VADVERRQSRHAAQASLANPADSMGSQACRASAAGPLRLGSGRGSPVFFPQAPRRFDFVLELDIDLVQAHVGGRTRGKAAVGIERDPTGIDVLERLLDAEDNCFRRIDLARLATDAPQTD